MKRLLAVLLAIGALSSNAVYAGDTPSAWAVSDVKAAYDLGIAPDSLMNSYTKSITRREFCVLCARTLKAWGIESTESGASFSDITKDDGDIVYCASLGVVAGVGDGKFEPDRSITRQEAAKMLYNALAVTGLPDKNGGILLPHIFNDGDKISAWARDEIYAVYHTGVMLGDTKNRFNPSDSYTREQVICTLWRLYGLADGDSLNVKPEFYPIGKYEDSVKMSGYGSNKYYLNMAYSWYEGENKDYEPKYTDGFGNTYTASEVGYVYPTDGKYMEVVTYSGTGVGAKAIINKNKDEVTSDCSISEVYGIDGDYAAVQGDYKRELVDLKTGEYVTINGDAVEIIPVGCGMYRAGNQKMGYCFLNGDMKPVTDYRYMNLDYKFLNGMLAALTSDGVLEIINTEGQILKTTKIDLNRYSVYNICGTNAILYDSNGIDTYILRVASGELIKGYSNIEFSDDGEITAQKDNRTYILDINGKVKLKSGDTYSDIYSCGAYADFRLASKTSKTAPYIAKPYDVINTSGKVLASGLDSDNVIADGGGVFCGKKGNRELVVFDKDGTQLGTINTNADITSYEFINGLVRVQSDNKHVYYLPNGSKADFINNKVDIN